MIVLLSKHFSPSSFSTQVSRFVIFSVEQHGYYASWVEKLFKLFLMLHCLRFLSQDLVGFVHQQAAIVELSLTNARQSVINEELLVTIHEQSTLIQHLKEETGVRLSCLVSTIS